jgi:hypothetical protein
MQKVQSRSVLNLHGEVTYMQFYYGMTLTLEGRITRHLWLNIVGLAQICALTGSRRNKAPRSNYIFALIKT